MDSSGKIEKSGVRESVAEVSTEQPKVYACRPSKYHSYGRAGKNKGSSGGLTEGVWSVSTDKTPAIGATGSPSQAAPEVTLPSGAVGVGVAEESCGGVEG